MQRPAAGGSHVIVAFMSDTFDLIQAFLVEYGYLALFFGIMLENAGIPLPGETALVAAGFLSSAEGGDVFHLWMVIVVAFCGAVIGDNLGFLLGREVLRKRMAEGKGFLFVTPERVLRAERYFDRYGSLTIFFARFVALLRIVGGPAAGVSAMPWWRFLVANAAGAMVWSVTFAFIGHFAGHLWPVIHAWLGRGSWVIVGGIVIGIVLWNLLPLIRRRDKKTQTDH